MPEPLGPGGPCIFVEHKEKQANKQTDKQTDRQTDKQKDKQTDKPTDKPTDKQTELYAISNGTIESQTRT